VALNVAAGIPAVEVWGAAGAAYAAGAAELVVLGLVLVAVGREVRSSLLTRSLPVLGIGAGAAATLAVATSLPLAVSVVLTGMWCLLGLTTSGRGLRAASGTAGDDADVGQQVRRDVVGDGVEAVEHVSGPAQHL